MCKQFTDLWYSSVWTGDDTPDYKKSVSPMITLRSVYLAKNRQSDTKQEYIQVGLCVKHKGQGDRQSIQEGA